jgi:hypothetical protein
MRPPVFVSIALMHVPLTGYEHGPPTSGERFWTMTPAGAEMVES